MVFLDFSITQERDEKMNEEEKKELEGIRYIQEKNNMKDIKTVLALYNKLAEKNLFHTRVGLEFLDTMKKRLIESKEIQNQDIFGYEEPQIEETESRIQEKEDRYKYKYYNSLLINIILLAALIAGFFITTNSKNVNILNYENRLIDQYSAWEAELKERESIVTEREKAIQP